MTAMGNLGKTYGKFGTVIEPAGASASNLELSGHAEERMRQRGISKGTIRRAVENPTVVVRQRNKRVYLTERLGVVVDPESGPRVVTVFDEFTDVVQQILREAQP
ncbi:MAG: hypothetical protein BRD45_01975 [Bacteroidetes bacterium QS_8_64_10]|nr:MAG: hypothetical protein BRD45_01975 [Bacteroidetes bacterium QS_8_64_10]